MDKTKNRDITQLVNELTEKLGKTKFEKNEIEKSISDLDKERQKITDIIDQLSIEHDKLQTELTQDYKHQSEIDRLLTDTENSYGKIFESIKTLLTVVKKQEKTLVLK